MPDDYLLDVRKTSWEGGVLKLTDVQSRDDENKTIVLTATVSDRLVEWCQEHLDYEPFLKAEHVPDGLDKLWLVFKNESDAILVRIAFAHCWINE